LNGLKKRIGFLRGTFFLIVLFCGFFFFGIEKAEAAIDLTVTGVESLGSVYSENSALAPNYSSQQVITVRNTGSTPTPADTTIDVTVNYKFGGSTIYTQTHCLNSACRFWWDPVSIVLSGGSMVTEFGAGALTPGTWTIEACVDSGGSIAESNESNNCTSRSFNYIEPTPIISSLCTATLQNNINPNIDGFGNWRVDADITVLNCPSPRWTNLAVDGSGDVILSPWRVFDTALSPPNWRSFLSSGADCQDRSKMEDADLCLQGYRVDVLQDG
jgi:hypothetical protein